MKGGKQPGAGRPKAEPTTPVTVRLTAAKKDKFMEMGGARWVNRLIDEALAKDKACSKKDAPI